MRLIPSIGILSVTPLLALDAAMAQDSLQPTSGYVRCLNEKLYLHGPLRVDDQADMKQQIDATMRDCLVVRSASIEADVANAESHKRSRSHDARDGIARSYDDYDVRFQRLMKIKPPEELLRRAIQRQKHNHWESE